MSGLGATAWVDRLLNEHWDAIVAATPEGAIPEIGAISKRGKVTANEYGCGHYGCVMPTADSNLVCKVTSDESEAFFVQAALELGQPDDADGMVRYLDIRAFPESSRYRSRKVFILWREAARDIGGRFPHPWGFTKPEEVRQSDEVFGLTDAFQQGAMVVREVLKQKRAKPVKELLDEVQAWDDWAYDFAAEHLEDIARAQRRTTVSNGKTVAKLTRGLPAARRYAAGLSICKHAAEHLENTWLGDALGRAFAFYLDQGLLLADVHASNMGRVDRVYDDGNPWTPLVITDPGHAVVLDERRWEHVRIAEL